ncbi:MAG: DUF4097 family beta strand repeat-containing protein [Kangiellaceae bacterium]|jgi:DUF4097 and DUF4098 domain-containing protein YvlB|nr:DUF4097 family beta strand repeat-containing protein [Kangiellaceae bacterium]
MSESSNLLFYYSCLSINNYQGVKMLIAKYVVSIISITTLSACMVVKASAADGGDISSVLGGIKVASGQVAGDLDSVNGSIKIGNNAKAEDVEAVNGSVKIGKSVTLRSVATVNGRISAGQGLTVVKSVETVNGRISLDSGSEVGGDVSTVNGGIELDGVTVSGDLSTNNGNIELQSTTVKGDIEVKKSKGWFNSDSDDNPVISIDATSKVGDIHLYREVKLEISEQAKVGQVIYHYKD